MGRADDSGGGSAALGQGRKLISVLARSEDGLGSDHTRHWGAHRFETPHPSQSLPPVGPGVTRPDGFDEWGDGAIGALPAEPLAGSPPDWVPVPQAFASEPGGQCSRTGVYSPGQSAYASSGLSVSFAADAPYLAATSLTG